MHCMSIICICVNVSAYVDRGAGNMKVCLCEWACNAKVRVLAIMGNEWVKCTRVCMNAVCMYGCVGVNVCVFGQVLERVRAIVVKSTEIKKCG